jgi:hypothetical protein
MSDWTVAANSTSFTSDDIRKAIGEAVAKMPPKSEVATAIEASPAVIFWLETRLPVMAASQLDRFHGLPVEFRLDIPYGSWTCRFADGSRVMHYADGRTMRCLPMPPGEIPEFDETAARFFRHRHL